MAAAPAFARGRTPSSSRRGRPAWALLQKPVPLGYRLASGSLPSPASSPAAATPSAVRLPRHSLWRTGSPPCPGDRGCPRRNAHRDRGRGRRCPRRQPRTHRAAGIDFHSAILAPAILARQAERRREHGRFRFGYGSHASEPVPTPNRFPLVVLLVFVRQVSGCSRCFIEVWKIRLGCNSTNKNGPAMSVLGPEIGCGGWI